MITLVSPVALDSIFKKKKKRLITKINNLISPLVYPTDIKLLLDKELIE